MHDIRRLTVQSAADTWRYLLYETSIRVPRTLHNSLDSFVDFCLVTLVHAWSLPQSLLPE